MAKVGKTITRALRILRVVDATETPEAEDAQTALEALNAMMMRWEADGNSVGWSPVESLDEELPAPFEAEDAIVFNLAIVLRPEYGLPLDQDVYIMAERGLSAIRRDVAVANPSTFDNCRGGYDIRSDTFY